MMSKIRLLVLDDNPVDLELASIAASRAAVRTGVKLTLHVVETWAEARMVSKDGIDVAIVDVGLTDADGREAAARLEETGVRTIMWTGNPTMENDVAKRGGVTTLTDRLAVEFETVTRCRPTDPDLPIVLLVEDDDVDADLMSRALSETGQKYTMTRVGTSEEAIRVMTDGLRPQLLIVDEGLPGLTGGALLRIMRGHPEWGDPFVYRYTNDPTTTAGKMSLHKPPSVMEVESALLFAKAAAMLPMIVAMSATAR